MLGEAFTMATDAGAHAPMAPNQRKRNRNAAKSCGRQGTKLSELLFDVLPVGQSDVIERLCELIADVRQNS